MKVNFLQALTNKNEILLAPQGLFSHEITASSFAKLSIEGGQVVDEGSTNLSFDLNKLDLHLAIYSSREEVRCVIHMTSPMAVSVRSSPYSPNKHKTLCHIMRRGFVYSLPNYYDLYCQIPRKIGPSAHCTGSLDCFSLSFIQKQSKWNLSYSSCCRSRYAYFVRLLCFDGVGERDVTKGHWQHAVTLSKLRRLRSTSASWRLVLFS